MYCMYTYYNIMCMPVLRPQTFRNFAHKANVPTTNKEGKLGLSLCHYVINSSFRMQSLGASKRMEAARLQCKFSKKCPLPNERWKERSFKYKRRQPGRRIAALQLHQCLSSFTLLNHSLLKSRHIWHQEGTGENRWVPNSEGTLTTYLKHTPTLVPKSVYWTRQRHDFKGSGSLSANCSELSLTRRKAYRIYVSFLK